MINLDNAKLIGEGEWTKFSAYRVYELDGKFYAVMVLSDSSELLGAVEIKKEDISTYI
jgi:hypothetical protein